MKIRHDLINRQIQMIGSYGRMFIQFPNHKFFQLDMHKGRQWFHLVYNQSYTTAQSHYMGVIVTKNLGRK